MFGYITADTGALDEAGLDRYRGCYCGLCRTLRRRHGQASGLTLNYDMTFLVLLLGGLYEPAETAGEGRCGPHPLRARTWWTSRFTDYAADMNVALAYFNLLDDWRDDRSPGALAAAKALRRSYAAVKERWPVQCAAIEGRLEALSEIESAGAAGPGGGDPDAAANCFGALMGALFDCGEDAHWDPRLRAFGEALGRFIYMLDACADLERDRKKGCYNPLFFYDPPLTDGEKTGMLKMLIGECTERFEALPILRDAEILRNILYSGVWTRPAAGRAQKGGTPRG